MKKKGVSHAKALLLSVSLVVLSITIMVYAHKAYADTYVDATAVAYMFPGGGNAGAWVASWSDAVWNGWYNIYASVNGSGPSDGGPFRGIFSDYTGTAAEGSYAYAYAGISGYLYGMTYVGDSQSKYAP